MIAEMAVKHKVDEFEFRLKRLLRFLGLLQNAQEFGREGHVGLVLVLAALGTSLGFARRLALGRGALLLLLFAFSDQLFLFFGSDHLFA